jgi:hypothetical protein
VWRASPSSVQTFRECPARWGFAKLPGGTREPSTDATEFGTDVHTERERYLRAATHPDPVVRAFGYAFPDTREGVTARALSEHLPAGLPPYGYFEVDHEYDTGEGVVCHGFPDMAWPEPRESLAVTADYKTTGAMLYAKLERDALFGHPQAPLYTLINMRKWGFDKGRALWLYAERPPLVKPPGGWPRVRVEESNHLITRDEATERVHLLMVPAAKEMHAIYTSGMTAAQAGELPKNLRHCLSFGRLCPFHATCNPRKEQQMDEANAFLAGIGLGTTTAAVPPTTPATGSAPATSPATTTTDATAPATGPAVNPPEAAGKKGKGRAGAPTGLTAADIDAIAEAVADKMALRLMRNVP